MQRILVQSVSKLRQSTIVSVQKIKITAIDLQIYVNLPIYLHGVPNKFESINSSKEHTYREIKNDASFSNRNYSVGEKDAGWNEVPHRTTYTTRGYSPFRPLLGVLYPRGRYSEEPARFESRGDAAGI